MANAQSVLVGYVSDMLALERHVQQPLKSQLEDKQTQQYPEALNVIGAMNDTISSHIAALEQRLGAMGGDGTAHSVKEGLTQAAGFVASAIDMLREHKVSKMLRDDYTATSLRSVSYTMLYSAALANQDDAVATLALRHLNEVNDQIVALSQAIPAVVIKELAAAGHGSSDPALVDRAVTETQKTWNKK